MRKAASLRSRFSRVGGCRRRGALRSQSAPESGRARTTRSRKRTSSSSSADRHSSRKYSTTNRSEPSNELEAAAARSRGRARRGRARSASPRCARTRPGSTSSATLTPAPAGGAPASYSDIRRSSGAELDRARSVQGVGQRVGRRVRPASSSLRPRRETRGQRVGPPSRLPLRGQAGARSSIDRSSAPPPVAAPASVLGGRMPRSRAAAPQRLTQEDAGSLSARADRQPGERLRSAARRDLAEQRRLAVSGGRGDQATVGARTVASASPAPPRDDALAGRRRLAGTRGRGAADIQGEPRSAPGAALRRPPRVRLDAPSLRYAEIACVLTVCRERKRWAPISRKDRCVPSSGSRRSSARLSLTVWPVSAGRDRRHLARRAGRVRDEGRPRSGRA